MRVVSSENKYGRNEYIVELDKPMTDEQLLEHFNYHPELGGRVEQYNQYKKVVVYND